MAVSTSDKEAVLVIGSTGRHGGTGARVVERLQAAGRLVRALVRSDDDRAQHEASACDSLGKLQVLIPPLYEFRTRSSSPPSAAAAPLRRRRPLVHRRCVSTLS